MLIRVGMGDELKSLLACRFAAVVATLCMLVGFSASAGAATVIHAGWLFEADSGRLLERQSVCLLYTSPSPRD